jgi:hypothetical protein
MMAWCGWSQHDDSGRAARAAVEDVQEEEEEEVRANE